MNAEQLRELSLDTSLTAIRNIAAADHSGLVTIEMQRGVVRRVWCGTSAGILVWKGGLTLIHLIPNVEPPLEHG